MSVVYKGYYLDSTIQRKVPPVFNYYSFRLSFILHRKKNTNSGLDKLIHVYKCALAKILCVEAKLNKYTYFLKKPITLNI
jgi:hypothetical protein